jgi:D-amino-acid dehydrogenase
MESTHGDVLILGGGVIGLACALYLLKAGASVRVLEQGTPGCGSSHGNCGTITPSHAAPLAMPGMIGVALRSMLRADAPLYLNPRFDGARLRWLLGFARHCNWRDFATATTARCSILQRSRQLLGKLVRDEKLDCEFSEQGTLYVYRTQKLRQADEKEHAALLDDLGIEVQRLSGEQVEAMEPALKPSVVGGLLHPGDASLRPDRYVAELARRVVELGGVIEQGARIERFDTDGRRITRVHSSGGAFDAERVVMALGAWSPLLAKQLALRLPMQPGKGYSLTYSRPRLVPRHALALREASVCVTSWSDGYRLGSTMEFSGYVEGLNQIRLGALRRGAAAGRI